MSNITKTTQQAEEAQETRLPEFLRVLLERRGLTDAEEIERFLNPDYDRDTHDPHGLKHIDKAASRIWEAIEKEQTIRIFSDYDVDGVSAAAILHDFFDAVDYPAGVYIPDRREEGHGLNMQAVEDFIEDGVDLIITLDCGVTGHKEIARAAEAGVDVIVVDHHQVVGGLPPAYAVVDPHQEGDSYPFKGLCGAGLAFKLVQVLVEDERMDGRWKEGQEKWLLDLVALASVADMMPMRGENRALVRYGLFVLAQTKRPGLEELFAVSRVEPRVTPGSLLTNITETTIGFTLGPRINAASRMAHADLAYDLITASTSRAGRTLALELEEHNVQRKKDVRDIEKRLYGRIEARDDIPPFIVECSDKWPVSLLGLVAGRVAERYGRPVMLADTSKDIAKASFRAPDHYNLIEALSAIENDLVQHGGHAAAAGCSFLTEKFEVVKKGLQKHAKANGIDSAGAAPAEEPIELGLSDITLANVELTEQLAPFGEGNPRPRFKVAGVNLAEVRLMGKANNHAKLYVTDEVGHKRDMLLFFHNGEADGLQTGEQYDIVGELSVNEWNGTRKPQFKIVEIQRSGDR